MSITLFVTLLLLFVSARRMLVNTSIWLPLRENIKTYNTLHVSSYHEIINFTMNLMIEI